MAGVKLWWMMCALLLVDSRGINAECSAPLGMASRAIADSQITASSTYYDLMKPEDARLRNTESTFGGWCAEDTDTDPYLEIDFIHETVVWEIATQGLEQPSGNWVTQYAVNYSCDGTVWNTHKENNKRKVFVGNDDASSIERRSLSVPVIARYIRIIPLDKKPHGLACLRVEMYGCNEDKSNGVTDCNVATGMEDGRIASAQVTASSSTVDHVAANGRLNHVTQRTNGSVRWGAWCTDQLDNRQYLQIDMSNVRTISGVATQGYNKGGWVTEYKVQYSVDGKTWDSYKENITDDASVFAGNWDADTVVHKRFERVFPARFVRVNPVTWDTAGSICMRVEVYQCVHYTGCSKPPSTTTSTSHQSPDHSSIRPTVEPLTGSPSQVPTHRGGVLVGASDSSASALSTTLCLIWTLVLIAVLMQ